MIDFREEIKSALVVIRSRLGAPDAGAALVTGSGLAGVIDAGHILAALDYGDIPCLPEPTVPGHNGKLGLVEFATRRFLFFNGRAHLYEGQPVQRLGMAVRIAAAVGAKAIVSTCAVGSLKPEIPTGTIVVVDDHINFTGADPLTGVAPPDGGERFPDTSRLYTRSFIQAALDAAGQRGISCVSGTYAWVSGPSYETPAETRALAGLGADVVGMSLVPETLIAAQLGLKVLALGAVTNLAPGLEEKTLCHSDVLKAGESMVEPLARIIEAVAPNLFV